jgi:hypothetical protein
MRTTAITATLLYLMSFTSALADNLPNIRQVYAAANAGQLTQARAMVDQVLAAKPDSAKGHFVKAEICAAQLDRSCSRDELASAKRLEPGLTFANPTAVRKLETLTLGPTPLQRSKPNSESGFNWTWVALGLGIIALLWWVVSIATRRAAQNANLAYAGGAMVPASPTNTMGGVCPQAMARPSRQAGLAWDWARALPPVRHWAPAWLPERRWLTAFCIEVRVPR